MKIWIIHGSTGEYSDRCEWVVEAHGSEEAAQTRIKRLDALMLEVGANDPKTKYTGRRVASDAMKAHPDGDPQFMSDYTGTSYFYSSCELKP